MATVECQVLVLSDMGAGESKLDFRKGVFRLFEERNIPRELDEYWSLFWTLPESADDVFSLIGATDIRNIRDSARENLGTLIDKLIDRLEQCVHTPQFLAKPDAVKHVLNCHRILTRIMPFVFEDPACADWERTFFWNQSSGLDSASPEQKQDPSPAESALNVKSPTEDSQPLSRGHRILILTIESLFLAGFTLPANMASKDSSIVYEIWEKGIGSSVSLGSYKDIDMNRTEVLRLLLVLLSKSIYVSTRHFFDVPDNWLQEVTSRINRKTILVLLCSLLNTTCQYDPVGWGVPYNHIVVADARETLCLMCLRVLVLLLDFLPPGPINESKAQVNKEPSQTEPITPATPEENKHTENEPTSPTYSTYSVDILANEVDVHRNAFRHYAAKLHRTKDFEFLVDNFLRILRNPMEASNTYLPRSTKSNRCYTEMLMLFWKLVEVNARFRHYIYTSEKGPDMMVVIIYYLVEYKTDLVHDGLVKMCVFILQTLSADRDFSIHLNSPFRSNSSLPAGVRLPSFYGTYADFLIISIFNVIATSKGTRAALYPSLFVTISNISPYIKNISVTAASKLMTLFKSMTSPKYMLAAEQNHFVIFYLLETFNNMINYHFADNFNLVYELVRNSDVFYQLRDLKFSDAMADLEKARHRKQSHESSIHDGTPSDLTPATATFEKQGSSQPDQDSSTRKDQTEPDQNKAIAPTEDDVTKENASSPKASLEKADDDSDQEQGDKIVESSETDLKAEDDATNEDPPASLQNEEAPGDTDQHVNQDTQPSEPTESIPTEKSSPSATTKSDSHQDEQDQAPLKGEQAPPKANSSLKQPPFVHFQPTEAWMTYWIRHLPIRTVIALLDYLVDQVNQQCADGTLASDADVVEFLRNVTVVGILPHPNPLVVRRYDWSAMHVVWFRSYFWGQAWSSSLFGIGPWNGTNVALFQIKTN